MDFLRPLASAVRRHLLSGRRALVVLAALLLVWIVIGFVWALLLGIVLVAALVTGDKPTVTATAPRAPASSTPPAPRSESPPAASRSTGDGAGPTLEKAYSKIGLRQLPPFEGLGEVRTYEGPRKIRLMPDNPIEQRFDGKAITFRSQDPMRWVSGEDHKGQKTFVEAKELRVPSEDITAVKWREPDPRFTGSAGHGDLSVEYLVGDGPRGRTKGLSRPAYVPVHRVAEFRQLRDALSAATGLPVTALPTCLDVQARGLLREASAPYQVMGADGRPVRMPPKPL